ncbi:sulfatase-like hydrolase/transferase, partial [Streptomyces sp. TRM76130]|nr:sulfatase-like hydrolase/transferase [Streptomyces sp. TRM76130]
RVPGYETDGLTDILLDWLGEQTRERAGQPFFAVLSVQPPHNPYTAPAEDMARHTPGEVRLRPNVPDVPRITERARRDLAGYYAAIERVDHNVGRVRAALDTLGLADRTYLVFLSDHGDLHGSHGQWHKTAPWEESIRIPFLIGGPSREHQYPNRPDVPVNHVDIAPTTLGLCGLP